MDPLNLTATQFDFLTFKYSPIHYFLLCSRKYLELSLICDSEFSASRRRNFLLTIYVSNFLFLMSFQLKTTNSILLDHLLNRCV